MVDDDKLIAALLTSPTHKAAAEACGITDRQLRNRMKQEGFQGQYDEARRALVTEALGRAQASLTGCMEELVSVMQDFATPPQTRVSAAQTLINASVKLSEVVDVNQRLDRIEAALNER